jgi:PPM family protein phosphatase
MSTNPQARTVDFPLPIASEAALRPPASVPTHVDLGALSHIGHVRSNNEDMYHVAAVGRTMHTLLSNLPEGAVPARYEETAYGMVVADGMGGLAAGEVASRLAITTLVNLVLNTPDWIMRPGEEETERVLERMVTRYREIDATLSAQAAVNPALAGMGTTMTAACSLGPTLMLAHVGDSRIYLRHGDEIYRLTRDQTRAQALADLGLIRPEQVATHSLRHTLTQALGGGVGGSELNIEVGRLTLTDGDQVLLCTDGLTEMVDDDAIAGILRGGGAAQGVCQTLVDMALENGGRDNVTVVLARYHFSD